MSEQNDLTRRYAQEFKAHEASRHPQAYLEQIAAVLGLPYADSDLPERVAKLAAREKLYTETVKALVEEFQNAILLRDDMGLETVRLRQLLSLAREANGKGTE